MQRSRPRLRPPAPPRPLLNQRGIEIRVLGGSAHQTIHRYDEQLLLTIHLHGQDAEQAPLLHIHRAAPGGLFDRFTEHYNHLWEEDPQPIRSDLDIDRDEDKDEGENPESDPPLPGAERPAASRGEPSAPTPRRWPRRPT
jgi:hypothetical protein